MTKLPITVVIPTKNEAENIAAAIRSVIDHFEAVVVVDSHSTDDTCSIAATLGAEVVSYAWDGAYPKKKQWCLDNVRSRTRWVLFLDGDERVSLALLAELRYVFSRPVKAAAFDIPLDYWFAGRRLRHGYTIVKRALMDRTRCHFPVLDDLDAPGMGEQEGHYQPVAEDSSEAVRRLKSPIEHEDLDPVRTWFDRHNRYSDWEAWLEHHPEVKESTRQAKSRQGQLFHKAPLKPLVSFVYAYLYKRGFLDGRAGLDYALAMSFYRWQIGLKARELKTERP
ncbi:glycosyltransferase family 2 protein [Streptomyces sp. L2]|uniref:glycosyltransferase family 2 protein n=1 Tax=Streptomyces sp. L2 TaxID=2162665 RepID=UPI00101272DE|nr:glycosyltransferase family 2 protein [Streptomyces sp. L2]